MREMLRRAWRTFIQAFAAYVAAHAVAAVSGVTTVDALQTAVFGLVVAAIAAGIAAIMNMPQPNKTDSPEGSDNE